MQLRAAIEFGGSTLSLMGDEEEVPRWYASRPGRWDAAVEDALASADARRRNLAWIMLARVGGGRGCQSEFARLIGRGQGQISNWLRGERELTRESLEAICHGTAVELDDLLRPDHPLAIRHGSGRAWEPGDPEWFLWWSVWRAADPDAHPAIAELLRDYPQLFPVGFLENSS